MITEYENKDMAQFITIRNKSKVTLHGLLPNSEMKIQVDRDGTPLDKNWRRRMKDASLDKCIEEIKEVEEETCSEIESTSEMSEEEKPKSKRGNKSKKT